MRVFCKMTFIDGFIHADLHPGNIRFMRDNRIALFDLGLTAELTDGQLLECYISRREEAAFAALVQRYGPMVWGVCRPQRHNPLTRPPATPSAGKGPSPKIKSGESGTSTTTPPPARHTC